MNDDADHTMAVQAPPGAAGAAAERLRIWLEGERADPSAVDVFVEPDAPIDAVKQLPAGDVGWVFAEQGQAEALAGTGTRVVPYTGRLDLLGGEVALAADVLVQTESYATAAYVAISVPTAFSVADEVDLSALRIDAEVALTEGRFPDHLTTPIVTVVDERALLVPILPPLPHVARLLVRADGEVLDGPLGAQTGPDLGRAAPQRAGRDAVSLARFLGAAKVIRALRSRFGTEVEIADFGPQRRIPARERDDSVFVASAAGQAYVVDLATRRVSRVPSPIAELVEHMFSTSRGAGFDASERSVLERLGLQRYDVPAPIGAAE
ncbi:hypothetical protein LK09_15300 [Microbacterium mangrovi]|uniref:Uncharacterized protein n=1 Tax=Microbacterium mangrovi TaxID=1348253 RepID=A0A0B2A3K6_9MICO|nr:hypothetical protein [Microbacterium mangrovi]KHK96354.1 hypothetical protein LK09_15300 [Microbacterium mangrovi]